MKKPHLYFWVAAALTVYIGFELYRKIRIPDLIINIYDIYFVIYNYDISILISYALALIGLVYYLHYTFNIKLFKFLIKIHTYTTIGCVILYFTSPLIQFKKNINFPLFNKNTSFDNYINNLFIAFLLIQIILIFNSLISTIIFFSKRNKL